MKQLGRQSPAEPFFIYYNREKDSPLLSEWGNHLICNRLHPKYGCKVTKGKLILLCPSLYNFFYEIMWNCIKRFAEIKIKQIIEHLTKGLTIPNLFAKLEKCF